MSKQIVYLIILAIILLFQDMAYPQVASIEDNLNITVSCAEYENIKHSFVFQYNASPFPHWKLEDALLQRSGRSAGNPYAALPQSHIMKDVNPVILRAAEFDACSTVLPKRSLRQRALNANINVTYIDFPSEARSAFQYAVYIWERLINSAVPIQVVADWSPLEEDVLGYAGAGAYVRDFIGAPEPNTWYPIALANKLANMDLAPGEADIFVSLTSVRPDLYFGIDGNPPLGHFDFVSIVLHEICHGLGFAGSMTVSDGQGSWGDDTPFPYIYDRFAVNGSAQSLLDTSMFFNPSEALANELQSGEVFFNGPNATAVTNGLNPKLYAPFPWEYGSSYSHLDEYTYLPGDYNSLMTPEISWSEAIHQPGPIIEGVFRDIGWTIEGFREDCLTIGDDLKIKLYCVEYQGKKYAFDLEYYQEPFPHWKLNAETLQVRDNCPDTNKGGPAYWGVINRLCCDKDTAMQFNVAIDSVTMTSLTPKCPPSPTWAGYVPTTSGARSFSFAYGASWCGHGSGNGQVIFEPNKYYTFELQKMDEGKIKIVLYESDTQSRGSSQSRTDCRVLKVNYSSVRHAQNPFFK